MADNKEMQSGNLLNRNEQKQAETARNEANNANTIKNAADVAIASKNPYAVAAGAAIKGADKVTGGKSTEFLAKDMTKTLKHTPGGKKIQNVSNKLSESGAGDKIGQAASMAGGGKGAAGAAGAAEKGAAGAANAGKANNLINDSKRNSLDSSNRMNKLNKAGNKDNELDNNFRKHNNLNNFNNNRDSFGDEKTNNKESLNSGEENKNNIKKKKPKEKEKKKFSFLDIEEDEEGNKKLSIDFVGLIGKKYIIIGGAILLFVVIVVASFAASISSPASASGQEMNEGICMLDNNNTGDDCEENGEAAKAFHKLVKELKKEYANDGKKFNATYIAGFYVVVSNERGSNLSYENFTKDKIKKVIDAMFDDNGTYSEDVFKKNLEKDILPEYISGKDSKYYKKVVTKIFDYAARYKEIYGEEEQEEQEEDSGDYSDSDYAIKLVKVAKDQLKDSNSSKVGGAKYKKFMNISMGTAWCAAFVSWCANEAGIPKNIITHTTGVDYFIKQGRQQHTIHKALSDYEPKPGDLVIWKKRDFPNSSTSSHVGIVEKYDSKTKTVTTIEGNTGVNDNTSSRVDRNTHAKNTIGAFVSPKYPQTNGKLKGNTIIVPSGLGTSGTRMFDLASTKEQLQYVRSHGIQNPHGYPDGYAQRKVQDVWIKAGGKYKKGFCALDGRYLVAVTQTFGDFGDKVDFYMSDGTVIPTVIIEHKSMVKTSYDQHPANKWGHNNGKNILEFTGKTSKIGNNPYHALGIHGQTVKKAVNGGSIYK